MARLDCPVCGRPCRKNRMYCGAECRNQMRSALQFVQNYCPICANPIERKRYGGKWENMTHYNARQTCGDPMCRSALAISRRGAMLSPEEAIERIRRVSPYTAEMAEVQLRERRRRLNAPETR